MKVNKLIIAGVAIALFLVAIVSIRISLLVTAVLLFLTFVLVTSIADADDLDDLLRRYLK